jgi:tripartite-type tricarboxylate transporter receptor subunit TctC
MAWIVRERSMPDRFALCRRAALAAGGVLLAAPAIAQTPWPNRPIRLVVPFAPGGSTDVVGRLLAEQLQPRLGQPIVIDNRPGAGSTLGTAMVADAAPDGYTLLLSVISAFSVGSTLYRGRITWDPDRSFAHIGMINCTFYALMAHPRAPFSNPAELVAQARRTPGIAYGTSGVGSIPHLVMLRFAQTANIDLTHVPYRGGAQAVQDAIAGTIPVVLDGIPASVSHIRNGALRGIGMTSPERMPEFPDVPTFAEHGFREFVVEGWAGIAAPAGTPRAITERFAAALREVLALPTVLERYRGLATEPGNRFLDEMQAFVRQDAEIWRPVVIASGATAD